LAENPGAALTMNDTVLMVEMNSKSFTASKLMVARWMPGRIEWAPVTNSKVEPFGWARATYCPENKPPRAGLRFHHQK